MTEVTQILARIEAGDRAAPDQLLPLVYAELRRLAAVRMASERCDHTLQPTALVHEAWLRLVNAKDCGPWNGRAHFFAAAAEAMRRILIESARAKQRQKRGGDLKRVPLDEAFAAETQDPGFVLMVDEAIEQLAAEDQRLATLVKLRYFAGFSLTAAAEVLEISRSTATEDWAYAKARLRIMLQDRELPTAP